MQFEKMPIDNGNESAFVAFQTIIQTTFNGYVVR